MDEIYLSDKNVANQTKKLIAYLNLDRDQLTKNTVLKCKQIIINSMNSTYNKYGDRRPEDISLVEYIDKMNKKSLSDCIKVFDARKETTIQSKKYSNPQSNSQLKDSTQKNKSQDKNQYGLQANGNQYMRPDEIMGKMKNPQHPDQATAPSREYQSYSDAGGYASFSSVDTASGPFITATGEYGLPIEMQNQNNAQYPVISTDGKKNYADDLQKKMDSLRYEGGYGGAPGMGQQGMGQQGMGQQGMGQGMQMDMIQKLLPGVDMSSVIGQQQGQGQNQFQRQGQNQMQGNQSQNNQSQNNPMAQFAQLNQMMNQMQQSGQMNPLIMQQIMGQMQMLMSQMQNQGQGNQMQGNQMHNQGQGNQMQGNQMQGNQMQNQGHSNQMQGSQQQAGSSEFDYSFNSGGENVGNDFNAAYNGSGASNGYDGVDSFDGVYQHNSITGPVKNLTDQDGDLNSSLERMKAEREQVNKNLGNIPKPATFDPMQSPSQMNGNQNNQYNPNNGFFF